MYTNREGKRELTLIANTTRVNLNLVYRAERNKSASVISQIGKPSSRPLSIVLGRTATRARWHRRVCVYVLAEIAPITSLNDKTRCNCANGTALLPGDLLDIFFLRADKKFASDENRDGRRKETEKERERGKRMMNACPRNHRRCGCGGGGDDGDGCKSLKITVSAVDMRVIEKRADERERGREGEAVYVCSVTLSDVGRLSHPLYVEEYNRRKGGATPTLTSQCSPTRRSSPPRPSIDERNA